MIYDVCVVGQVVKDYNFFHSKGKKFVSSPGGAGFYSSYIYNLLGTLILTMLTIIMNFEIIKRLLTLKNKTIQ